MTRGSFCTCVERALGQHRALVQHGDLAPSAAHELHVVLDHDDRVVPAISRSSSAVRFGLGVGHARRPARRPAAARGSCISSMPISSHCFWPCESAPAGRCAGRSSADRLAAPRRCGRAARAVSRKNSERADAALAGCSASSRLSSTVWFSNTVGFWNLRPMPRLAIARLVEPGQVDAAVEEDRARVGPGLAGDDVHHRRLAGAVRADDRRAARPSST